MYEDEKLRSVVCVIGNCSLVGGGQRMGRKRTCIVYKWGTWGIYIRKDNVVINEITEQ